MKARSVASLAALFCGVPLAAHALVYVLEGAIQMQLKGGPLVTLKTGDTFYEGLNDVHAVGRNAGDSEAARFVVVLLKRRGAPVLTPVDGHK